MNVVSLVLRILPATRGETEEALHALPGVECHNMSEDGRLIVTVEDVPEATMSFSDTLIAIHRIPQVLAATLAYEHTEPDTIAPISLLPNSPCQEAQP